LARLALMLAIQVGWQARAEPLPEVPPYAGVYQPQGVDEIGFWREDDEDEKALAASNLVIRDETLTAYAKQVLCNTVGEDRCRSVRLYIIREPVFNATMTPNGTMRVFSGLLLRVHNEAELGAILGHEFGHFERRHGLAHFKAHRSGTDVLSWSTVLVGLAAAYGTRSTYQSTYRTHRDLEYSIYGNLFRYGRDQEREADMLGIAYLNKSNFRPQAASTVWRNLMAEFDASAKARGLKKPDFNRIAFTASHPPEGERATYLGALASPAGETRDDGAARYRAALASWMPVFLEDQIKLNDFGGSDYVIQSLAANGWTAALFHARGELYRTRGNQRDLANAADFYAKAIAADATLPEAYRGLGLALMKTGQPSEGQKALRSYLDLKPGASDAGLIRTMLPKEGISQ
jgi:predicted Zn-dependent protease